MLEKQVSHLQKWDRSDRSGQTSRTGQTCPTFSNGKLIFQYLLSIAYGVGRQE